MTTTRRRGDEQHMGRGGRHRGTSRCRGHPDGDDLGAVEPQYLDDVGRLLRDLPASHRRHLLDQTVEHLGERPPAAEPRELWAAIGMPRAYAAELRSLPLPASEATPRRDVLGAIRRIPPSLTVFVVLSVAYVVGFTMWWYVPTPELSASGCTGVIGDGVEVLEAARVTEHVVPYEIGERFIVSLCLTKPDGSDESTLLGTALPDRSRVWRPVDIQLTGMRGEDVGTFDHGETIDVPVGPSTWIVDLSFEIHCDRSGDGGQSFDSIPFEVRHGRKTFVLDLDLGTRVTLQQAGSRCA